MKQGRQSVILDVIDEYDIETQDELSAILKDRGIEVTQATISRDIKELKLIKVQTETGTHKYAVSSNEMLGKVDVLRRVFRDTVVSIEAAASMVVVRTMSGSANAAAEAIDGLDMKEIAGTIAGDNTIFVAVREEGMQERVIDALSKMAGKK